jgi:hypothetical protein
MIYGMGDHDIADHYINEFDKGADNLFKAINKNIVDIFPWSKC